jgi:YD repeat-containing protein
VSSWPSLIAADRLTAIKTASGTATTFTIDALGRHASRAVGANPIESYSYLGSTNTVIGISTGSTTTLSAIDAVGNRIATAGGGAVGFLLPDLHGNTAGALNAAATSITDAFAYDAYGNTVASVTSALPTPWRFQGRIIESAAGTPDLYDFGARSYNPTLLNGYLYANANPATLVDPDGHCAISPSNRDEAMWCAAHANTTYGDAGPTGRTPADDLANSIRSTKTTSSPTPYGPPAPPQKPTLGNGVGVMSPTATTSSAASRTTSAAPSTQLAGQP